MQFQKDWPRARCDKFDQLFWKNRIWVSRQIIMVENLWQFPPIKPALRGIKWNNWSYRVLLHATKNRLKHWWMNCSQWFFAKSMCIFQANQIIFVFQLHRSISFARQWHIRGTLILTNFFHKDFFWLIVWWQKLRELFWKKKSSLHVETFIQKCTFWPNPRIKFPFRGFRHKIWQPNEFLQVKSCRLRPGLKKRSLWLWRTSYSSRQKNQPWKQFLPDSVHKFSYAKKCMETNFAEECFSSWKMSIETLMEGL